MPATLLGTYTLSETHVFHWFKHLSIILLTRSALPFRLVNELSLVVKLFPRKPRRPIAVDRAGFRSGTVSRAYSGGIERPRAHTA